MNYIICGFLLMFYYFWIWSQLMLASDTIPTGIIVDRLHDSEFVMSITTYLRENNSTARFHIGLTTFLIDASVILVGIISFYTYNWKCIIIYVGGIILRQLCQFINKLPIPSGMIWFDPGVWSLLMVYDVSGDFFFSGHTFTAMTIGFELMRYDNLIVKIYGGFFICYQISFVIVTRAHYFMDVYAAIATYFMVRYAYESLMARYN